MSPFALLFREFFLRLAGDRTPAEEAELRLFDLRNETIRKMNAATRPYRNLVRR